MRDVKLPWSERPGYRDNVNMNNINICNKKKIKLWVPAQEPSRNLRRCTRWFPYLRVTRFSSWVSPAMNRPQKACYISNYIWIADNESELIACTKTETRRKHCVGHQVLLHVRTPTAGGKAKADDRIRLWTWTKRFLFPRKPPANQYPVFIFNVP